MRSAAADDYKATAERLLYNQEVLSNPGSPPARGIEDDALPDDLDDMMEQVMGAIGGPASRWAGRGQKRKAAEDDEDDDVSGGEEDDEEEAEAGESDVEYAEADKKGKGKAKPKPQPKKRKKSPGKKVRPSPRNDRVALLLPLTRASPSQPTDAPPGQAHGKQASQFLQGA